MEESNKKKYGELEKLLQLYVEKLENDEIKNGNNLINCKPISEYIKIKEEEWEINKSSDNNI